MMKRTISMILAVLMTLSLLAGCGGKKASSDDRGESAGKPGTAESTPKQERELTLGVVEGNTYTNTYAGLGCTLDSDWIILPADQLQEWPDMVKDSVAGSELGDAMQNVQQFTDMYAESGSGMMNVNVLFQKLSAQERVSYAKLSEEQILDATLAQKDAMAEAYAAGGMELISMEKTKVTFLGEEHFALKTEMKQNGVNFYLLQLFSYHLGEYAVVVTLTSFLEDNTASMLELFYPVE